MKKNLLGIIAILLLSWIPLYSQGIQGIPDSIKVKILDARAELVRLRADTKADSATMEELRLAIHHLQVALQEAQTAIDQGARISADDKFLLKIAQDDLKAVQRELRKQKLLKWLFAGLSAVLTGIVIADHCRSP